MDLPTIDDRLSALESENANLRAEIESLKHPRRSPADKNLVEEVGAILGPIERQVTISTPAPVSTFVMPSESELAQLRDAVGRTHPGLLDSQGSAFSGTRHERRTEWNRQFEACFLAVGNMKRMDRPDTGKYLSYHVDVAESVLKSFGRPLTTLRGGPFLAACLAHFDVPVSGINRHHEGIVPEIGLHQYSGRPAGDAWRRIIEGQAPHECAVQRPPAPPSQTRVYGQGY